MQQRRSSVSALRFRRLQTLFDSLSSKLHVTFFSFFLISAAKEQRSSLYYTKVSPSVSSSLSFHFFLAFINRILWLWFIVSQSKVEILSRQSTLQEGDRSITAILVEFYTRQPNSPAAEGAIHQR